MAKNVIYIHDANIVFEDTNKRELYVVVKHTRTDFCGETEVISVAPTMELAKQSFDDAVKNEKAQQEKFGYSYDTVEEDDTSYTAFDEGYEATNSVSITITTAPLIG